MRRGLSSWHPTGRHAARTAPTRCGRHRTGQARRIFGLVGAVELAARLRLHADRREGGPAPRSARPRRSRLGGCLAADAHASGWAAAARNRRSKGTAMTDKEVFISRLRHAAAVRVVPPRRALVAVDAVPARVEFAIDTEGVDVFEAALSAVGGTVHRAADLVAARAVVGEVIGTRSPVVLGCEPDVAALELEGQRWPHCGLRAAAEAAVTVVGCVAMVAVTGSVVVDARLARGRSISLLPPVCVVVARSSQLVASPGDVLRHREDFWPGGVPSQVVFITGPSRSADIEMTLTRGVHGPGELHVVVVDG